FRSASSTRAVARCTIGRKRRCNWSRVVRRKYSVPAVSPPEMIPFASCTVIFFTESMKRARASGTAASAARFMVTTSSSAYLPIPTRRITRSARCADSGSGIFTCGLPRNPSTRPRFATAATLPFSSAAFSAAVASCRVMFSSWAKAAADPLTMTAARRARLISALSPVRREQHAGEDRRDTHRMEAAECLVEKGDREQRAECRQQMQGEAGGIGADELDAAVPADERDHRGRNAHVEHRDRGIERRHRRRRDDRACEEEGCEQGHAEERN